MPSRERYFITSIRKWWRLEANPNGRNKSKRWNS
jgi:hypothetical protein